MFKQYTMNVILDPEVVIQAVAAKLSSSYLVFAGSYPAAVRASEVDLALPYNDIDVYIEETSPSTTEPNSQYSDSNCSIVRVWKEDNVIPGSDIQINVITMDNLSLQGLINSFDTNCVRIGFSVRYDATQHTARILRWDDQRPEFTGFLQSRVLSIHDITALKSPAAAFIRLLYKAQQLGLEYELPDEDVLMNTLQNRCFGGSNKTRFENLEPAFKAQVTKRFDFEEFNWRATQMVRLIPRGDPVPNLTAVLQTRSLSQMLEDMRLTAMLGVLNVVPDYFI